ncbi:MAG: SgcJ/EcaC family oxidoreductase [Candidatus Solibacter sp.]
MTRYLLLMICAPLLFAQSDEITAMMKKSEAAWNRGDLPAFASDYEDSPETTFIGREITHGGVQAILERYRRGYSTAEKMGTLTYSEIEVRPLGKDYALANGKFALKRTAAGGGDAAGRFTLVLKKTKAGWKIIHDHSS